ncbi:rod shape-determining protein MreC [Leptolyngbya iicbica]|uniref:Cell shape-determining protein MreC n=2 Tax=Cyanophyceae TaxID=3028117 RepID=A0A4Q7ELS8_9CYAN|nr:rod shape-determining protein MreC [Leptolyngbya sp. LK]RZM82759.1 rod shape-determining protein MreC [Leptolyngbya sp. LK]
MFALRRWWNQYALKTGLVVLVIVAALGMRDSGGAVIYEMYRWVTRPFHPGPSREAMLQSSYAQELQQRLVELESQNRSLRQIVEGESSLPAEGVSAAVIGRSAGDWWQQIIISRGEQDGITLDDVVTGPGGLVGRVIAVSPNSSRVLLVSDPTSRVGARISRSRATGYIQGTMGQQVVLEFFDKDPDVKVGDVVTTSAYSKLFPQDIPIGRVVALDLAKSPAPEVTVELTAPLSIVEWVEVIPFAPKDITIPEARDTLQEVIPNRQEENEAEGDRTP